MSGYFDGKSAARVRSRKRGRRRAWAAAWTILAIIAALGAAMAVRRFGLDRVRAVRVSGGQRQEEALARALEPCLGRRLWCCGASGLAARYRKDHPEVERVRIAVLPWGTVAAEAVLRRPVARVDQGGLAIDALGHVFAAGAGEAEGLPTLRLAGSSEAGRRRAITALLTSGGCRPEWTVDCSDPDDIKLRLPGPTLVRLGNGRFPAKWDRLREIMGKDPGAGSPCTIDLRFHNQAVVRHQV